MQTAKVFCIIGTSEDKTYTHFIFGRPYEERVLVNGPHYATAGYALSVLSVCNVSVLWPNGWMDQDAT